MIWLTHIHACDVIPWWYGCSKLWVQVCWDTYYLFEFVTMFGLLVWLAWFSIILLKGIKWHVLTKWPLLAYFYIIYGLIHNVCGVLSPFSFLFPKILGSCRWRLIRDDLKKAWIFFIIQVGMSSLYVGYANILPLKFLYFSMTFMFISLSLLCYLCKPVGSLNLM